MYDMILGFHFYFSFVFFTPIHNFELCPAYNIKDIRQQIEGGVKIKKKKEMRSVGGGEKKWIN